MLDVSELVDFKDFAEDHIQTFNAIPCEFETKNGDVWGVDECWKIASLLGLHEEIEVDKPTVKMYALVTEDGTACAETALCENCYILNPNKNYAKEQGSQSDDVIIDSFVDCSENEALECCICGINIFGEVLHEDDE